MEFPLENFSQNNAVSYMDRAIYLPIFVAWGYFLNSGQSFNLKLIMHKYIRHSYKRKRERERKHVETEGRITPMLKIRDAVKRYKTKSRTILSTTVEIR